MILLGYANLVRSIEQVGMLFKRWRLQTEDWCLLDGPALRLHYPQFSASAWRDHFNLYVQEHTLPWATSELELTLPPMGSAELGHVIALAQKGTYVHLVPASRYYKAGFERKVVTLPTGLLVEAATLRGCVQIWSYRSVEIVDRILDFEGDLERIIGERLVRLRSALDLVSDPVTSETLILLQRGYEALQEQLPGEAAKLFRVAAGANWGNGDMIGIGESDVNKI